MRTRGMLAVALSVYSHTVDKAAAKGARHADVRRADVPLDKLRTESQRWETAYDELVRCASGKGG